MEFKKMVSEIINKTLKKDILFVVAETQYMFSYSTYEECCDDYGRNTVNEYLSDVEHMEGNGIYQVV